MVRYGVMRPSELPPFDIGSLVVNQNEKRYQFYTRLRESVEKDGFRNPILCYHKQSGSTLPYGHSRAKIAKDLGIDIPAIICDFVGDYTDCPRMDTVGEIRERFIDPPSIVEFWECGLNIWGCRQVHLAEKDADWFDDFQDKRNMARARKGRGLQTLDEYERFSRTRTSKV